MCGRFSISKEKDEIVEYLNNQYNIDSINAENLNPRYNVAPGQKILSVINDGKNYRAGLIKWGFVPFFAKDDKIGFSMINAKAETLNSKPSFKESFKNKRCIILADGFYEWKREGSSKIPMRFHLKDNQIFPIAGLWSSYTLPDGTALYTCTIITTNANSLVSSIHDRMPVILDNATSHLWLNPNIKDTDYLTKLLTPYEASLMDVYEVSSFVNSSKNDDIRCIENVKNSL